MSADSSEEQFEQKEAKVTKANGTGVRRWSFDKFPFELVTFDGLGLWPADLRLREAGVLTFQMPLSMPN